MTRADRKRGHVVRTVLAGLLALGVMTGAFSEDVLECEQAIAHLKDCCPDLRARAVCGDGCGTVTLTLEESECVQSLECGADANGVCDRVEKLSAEAADVEQPREPVCP